MLSLLKKRAEVLAATRSFFAQRGVLEVNTPLLSPAGSTDPYLDSFTTELTGGSAPTQQLYLHTSPEFYMKRLLAAGSGAIYQICSCFRNGELSARHNPEFLMLEWYRPSWTLQQLEDECLALVNSVLGEAEYIHLTYTQAFEKFVGLHPFAASLEDITAKAVEVSAINPEGLSRDNLLDLLLTHLIEPALKNLGRVLLYDFPASQAALAKVATNSEGHQVAQRFELYINGLEIANAYSELTCAKEQALRFKEDNQLRQQLGKPQIPADNQLVAALEKGLPEASGIALGLDRLIQLALGAEKLSQALPFPAPNW